MEGKRGASGLVAALAVIAIFLAGSSYLKVRSTLPVATEDSLAKIQRTHVMDVCVAEWPPFSIKDASTGSYSGVDIDILTKIATALGATIEYHDTTFGNAPAAVQSGTCDVTSELFVTMNRAVAVDFTRPIFYGGDAGLVRKGDTRFQTVADIDQPGLKVATATGESGDIYAKANFTKATLVPIDVDSADQTRFLLEVTSGRADIGIADFNTIDNFAKAHPETDVVLRSAPFNISPSSFAVRRGNTNLLNFMNSALFSLTVDGTVSRLEAQYGATALHEQTQIR